MAPGCAGTIAPTHPLFVVPFGAVVRRLAARHVTPHERLSLAARAAIDLVDRRRLRRREAVRRIGAGAACRHVARRVEAARARVVNQSILETVDGVALVHHLLRDQEQLRG